MYAITMCSNYWNADNDCFTVNLVAASVYESVEDLPDEILMNPDYGSDYRAVLKKEIHSDDPLDIRYWPDNVNDFDPAYVINVL